MTTENFRTYHYVDSVCVGYSDDTSKITVSQWEQLSAKQDEVDRLFDETLAREAEAKAKEAARLQALYDAYDLL